LLYVIAFLHVYKLRNQQKPIAFITQKKN